MTAPSQVGGKGEAIWRFIFAILSLGFAFHSAFVYDWVTFFAASSCYALTILDRKIEAAHASKQEHPNAR